NGTAALLGPGRERFLEDYKFHIAPATDDRPYFFRFFKWRLLPEVLAIRGRAGMTLLEGGYLIVAATLAQAAIVSTLLIVLPLAWIGRAEGAAPGTPGRGRVVVYFLALGLAFLFVEIAFIQRFVLFLGHPLYAISVVLAAFLVFAGVGSGYAARFAGQRAAARMRPISLAVAGIIVFAGVYLAVLPVIFGWLMPETDAVKILVSVVLIAPLAFFMGMPFPLGLRRVADEAPRLVPWAWGVNGCASVLSAVLASLLATHVGFTVVVALAMGLYGIAALAFAR
ncbi:MAG: SAM-dependent methyltransferase, partial [Proteobacteria bacterium]|nr:SAM-dependent methyltransferase [Pseudomonadota bacterium]